MHSSERGQPRRTYDINQRHAATWGWKVSAYLFTKSVAAGAFLVGALATLFSGMGVDATQTAALFKVGVPTALVFLALTGVLLVIDLKRPERFLWVVLRPQWRSWLVRGAYIISGFGALLTGVFLFGIDVTQGYGRVLAGLGGLLAAATACYSAWLFGQAKGRDLWQSPLVAPHLLVQALLAGVSFFSVARLFHDPLPNLQGFLQILIWTNAAFVIAEVWGRHATADAAAAAQLMTRGGRGIALALSLVAGHALPLALLGMGVSTALAALLAVIGVVIYEHLWVDAPQRLPLA